MRRPESKISVVLALAGSSPATRTAGLTGRRLAGRRRREGWRARIRPAAVRESVTRKAAARRRATARRAVVVGGGAAAGAAVLGFSLARSGRRVERAVHHAVTVNRPPDEVYRAWRRLEDLPRVLPHLDRVEQLDERRSHWVARAPRGRTVCWDAEIDADEPGRELAWHSVGGAGLPGHGRVAFRPAPRLGGTEVRLDLTYRPPAGRLGLAAARMVGEEPEQELRAGLRRFKSLLEAGEVITVEGQPSGRGRVASRVAAAVGHRTRTGGRP